MQITGTLISCKGFDFTDQENGRTIQGGKLFIGVPPESSSQNRHLIGGDDIANVPFDFPNVQKLKALADQYLYQKVNVVCELSLAGKNVKTKAVDIKPLTDK